jgi:hypothetical protein
LLFLIKLQVYVLKIDNCVFQGRSPLHAPGFAARPFCGSARIMLNWRAVVSGKQAEGQHEIGQWTGEFRAADSEHEFRLWAFEEDRRHFRRVALAIALIYASFVVVDYAAVGLHPTFYWTAATRAVVLALGVFCFGRLGRVADPTSMDRVALLCAVAAELGSFVIFAAIEQGPAEVRFDEVLLISKMVMITGVYLFLPNGFRTQLTIGWGSAAVDAALPLLGGSTSGRQIAPRKRCSSRSPTPLGCCSPAACIGCGAPTTCGSPRSASPTRL